MIRSLYSVKDATLYEKYPSLNTGIDALLEISKIVDQTSSYNSRVLVKFDLAELVSSYQLSVLTQTASFYLKLTAANPTEIPTEYTLYSYPVSQSWNMGTGRFSVKDSGSNGVSWNYKLTSLNTGSVWATSSFASTTTASWSTNPGGGNWYTSSVHSQSFNYETADVTINVTNTVRNWLLSTIPNEGFLIKRSDQDEQSTSTLLGALRFFSKESNTIYSPRLEMRYDDSIYHTSHSVVNHTEEVVVNITNLQEIYKETGQARMNVSARPKYPTRTHATSSNYLDIYQLPSSSFYSIRDAHTDITFVPFDETNTKISADANGNFFLLNFNGLPVQRYYKVLIMSKVGSNEQYYYDNNWIFKVIQ